MAFSERMRPLPLSQIKITDPFWSRRQRTIAEVSLPAQHRQLESTGRLANLRRCSGQETGPHEGIYFNDSDVYKWIEAAAYALANHPGEKLRALVDAAVEIIERAQQPDGYINSFFQLKNPNLKLRNLAAMHEMYCGGHLIEAGVALFQSTGDRRLLDVSIRFADLLVKTFGPDKRRGYCGHEEIELALVRLAYVSGESKYRDLARYMVEERGVRPTVFQAELEDEEAMALSPHLRRMMTLNGEYSGEYAQDHAPIREHTTVVGHAVRAMYLYAAAADLAKDQGDPALELALERCWKNLTGRRMYITGGIGPSGENEGFTNDFDLPNLTAYAETCAACGLIFWGQSMLEATGTSQYADVIERALYNGALSGISLDGEKYFYDNPLESRGRHARVPWFHCACCPPNIARLIGNLGSYVLGVGEDDVYVHQFAGFEAEAEFHGASVRLSCTSNFPWDGNLVIRVEPSSPVEFNMRIRLPDWADDVSTDLPGAGEAEYEDGYAVFRKLWQAGDVLTLEFELPPVWMEADPRVRDDLGRTALMRGPLVYCAEGVDNGFSPQLFTVDVEADLAEHWSPELDGHLAVTVEGFRLIEGETDDLYDPLGTVAEEESQLTLIPYYAWANRGKSDMQVWLRA